MVLAVGDACDSKGRCSGTLLSLSVRLTFLVLVSSSCCPLPLLSQAFGSRLTRALQWRPLLLGSLSPAECARFLLPRSPESPGGAIAQWNALPALHKASMAFGFVMELALLGHAVPGSCFLPRVQS